MDTRGKLARKKGNNIESSDSEYTIPCEDREVTAIESSTVSIDTALDFIKQMLVDMRRRDEKTNKTGENEKETEMKKREKMSVGKKRYSENESNVKLKLKKGVSRKSKKWTKEEWNMNFIC